MDIIVTTRRESGIPDEDILDLINRSYAVWKENGLDGPFMHYTLEEFRRETARANVFVAVEAGTGRLVGTHTFHANRRLKYVHGRLLAVAPDVRKQGIATRMLALEAERVRQAGFDYMRGFTAVSAEWSVRWHLRNGYRIIGYRKSPKENHYTYVFRKQLAPPTIKNLRYSLYSSALFCRCRFWVSYLHTRLLAQRGRTICDVGVFPL